MKTLFRFLAGGACGLIIVGLFWLAVEMDNADLQAGKSPHSGFSPSCPIPHLTHNPITQQTSHE